MLVHLYWSILVFILPHFANLQAIKWNIKACYPVKYRTSVLIILNKNNTKAIADMEDYSCYIAQFNLKFGEKPSYIQLPYDMEYNATVQNHDLQELYFGKCQSDCLKKHSELHKWVLWNVEVTYNLISDNYEYSFYIKPYVKVDMKFRARSKTSKASFFLPTDMNTKSKIELLTTGRFWLDKIIKLKNMETSKIYSCVYLLNQNTQTPYHECILGNDFVWKIELTSQLNLIKNIKEIKMFLEVIGSKTNFSQQLTFKRLAYLPTFSAFPENINIGEAEIYLEDTKKSFNIFKIVMRKILMGEEYGCVNIHKTNTSKYSCKLLKSKTWLLKVISPEDKEQNFNVEIIQDTLSFFARNLAWREFFPYGNSYIKYFKLKTFEDKEITNLKFHFFDKFLRIIEISIISNSSEYKFKSDGKSPNHMVTEFSRITKEKVEKGEKIHSKETIPVMKIVVGLLAVIVIFLIIICIVLRYKMLKNNSISKGKPSKHEVVPVDNIRKPSNNPNPVYTYENRAEPSYLHPNPRNPYENSDSRAVTEYEDNEGYIQIK